jgi:MFS family permease
MRDRGPETAQSRARREWFDDQEKRNLDRLEEGAKTVTQLVTGLYGVLFAVLALSNQPAYLQRPAVRWLGGLGVVAFFASLLAALVTLYPWRATFQQDNLSEMERAYAGMLRRKFWGLRVALWTFLAGIGFLGGVIVAVLWSC